MTDGGLITTGEMAAAVDTFLAALPPERRWDAEHSLDWDRADAGRLTEGHRSAVRFVTMIEDHLPGYFDVYRRHFPSTAASTRRCSPTIASSTTSRCAGPPRRTPTPAPWPGTRPRRE